jgi:hypothetical protein
MRYRTILKFLLIAPVAFVAIGRDNQEEEFNRNPDIQTVHAEVVATGIPGAGARTSCTMVARNPSPARSRLMAVKPRRPKRRSPR